MSNETLQNIGMGSPTTFSGHFLLAPLTCYFMLASEIPRWLALSMNHQGRHHFCPGVIIHGLVFHCFLMYHTAALTMSPAPGVCC